MPFREYNYAFWGISRNPIFNSTFLFEYTQAQNIVKIPTVTLDPDLSLFTLH